MSITLSNDMAGEVRMRVASDEYATAPGVIGDSQSTLTRQLELSSYDRLFPNQDALPKGGFGNLIALPLQKQPREHRHSVFVDDTLQPVADQWTFLAVVRRMDGRDIEGAIFRATSGAHPLDVAFITEEDEAEPWNPPPALPKRLAGAMPASLTLTLGNQLYFEKAQLPQSLLNRLVRIAAFQNSEFYRAQASGFSVWDKPRIVGRAENCPRHIALPRGCLDEVMTLLAEYLELSLNSGGSVIMMQKCNDVCAMYVGDARRDQDRLRYHGNIAATQAEEILEQTHAGRNRLEIGGQLYRFIRSFKHFEDRGAVVFAPS